MMEIPAGGVCDGAHICPFYGYDDGTEFCTVFDLNLYGVKCPACLSAYPNGAVVEIKPK